VHLKALAETGGISSGGNGIEFRARRRWPSSILLIIACLASQVFHAAAAASPPGSVCEKSLALHMVDRVGLSVHGEVIHKAHQRRTRIN